MVFSSFWFISLLLRSEKAFASPAMLLEPLADVPAAVCSVALDVAVDFTDLDAFVMFVLEAVMTTDALWLVSTVVAATTMVLRVVRALVRTLPGVCCSSSTVGLQIEHNYYPIQIDGNICGTYTVGTLLTGT